MSQDFTDDCFASGHVAQTDMQNIENNFAAVKSNFSGSAAPANLVAGMPWFDTDVNQLWIRKAANTSWMSLGFAPGTVMLFGQNTAPLGWTRKTNWQDNAMLCYAASGNIGSGGSANPQSVHNHSGGTVPNHTHNLAKGGPLVGTDPTGGVYVTASGGKMYTDAGTGSTTIYALDSATESGGGGGSTGDTGNNTAPHYQEVIAATKD